MVAQESVKEFQVVTSGYSAEAGRSGGGTINVVTKAGTNDFAGSTNLDLRVTKRFEFGGAQFEALFEVFNVLNAATFRVSGFD